MSRYIFSGGLTKLMEEKLKQVPDFHPIDVLVSQLDRSSIKNMIEFIEDGVVKSLFIDSGAYSYHTGKISNLDVDEYIDFVDSIDEYIYAVAQVDTIPGKFQKAKSKEDYIESANKSWENYLYMRSKMKSPEKLIPVFHQGEDFSALKRMLDYRDDSIFDKSAKPHPILGEVYPDRVNIIGLSPSNDRSQQDKDRYLSTCYDFIKNSSYPDAKTHLFGMTRLESLSKFPYYSADSVSHRLRTGYGKLYTRKWGVISVSDRQRAGANRSSMSFLALCDKHTEEEFLQLINHYGFTLDEIKNSVVARVVIDICETQKAVENEYRYSPDNLKRQKKLF